MWRNSIPVFAYAVQEHDIQRAIQERDSARRVARAMYACYLQLRRFDFDPYEEATAFEAVETARLVLAAEAKREAS